MVRRIDAINYVNTTYIDKNIAPSTNECAW